MVPTKSKGTCCVLSGFCYGFRVSCYGSITDHCAIRNSLKQVTSFGICQCRTSMFCVQAVRERSLDYLPECFGRSELSEKFVGGGSAWVLRRGVVGVALAKDNTFMFCRNSGWLTESCQSHNGAQGTITGSLLSCRTPAMVFLCHVIAPLLLSRQSGIVQTRCKFSDLPVPHQFVLCPGRSGEKIGLFPLVIWQAGSI